MTEAGNAAQQLGKLSSLGNRSPATGEIFQPLESFPSSWGDFPAPGIVPQQLGRFSSSGKTSRSVQGAFQLRENVPQRAGSFPASGIRPAQRRELSSFGNPSCSVQEAFPRRESVLQRAGRFPALFLYQIIAATASRSFSNCALRASSESKAISPRTRRRKETRMVSW